MEKHIFKKKYLYPKSRHLVDIDYSQICRYFQFSVKVLEDSAFYDEKLSNVQK